MVEFKFRDVTFHVKRDESSGHVVYRVMGGQWFDAESTASSSSYHPIFRNLLRQSMRKLI